MRLLLTCTALCAVAIGATAVFAQNEDPQSRALDALRKYSAEQNQPASSGPSSQPAAAEPAQSSAPVENDKVKQALEQQYQAENAPPAVAPVVVTTEHDEELRQALDQQYATGGAASAAALLAAEDEEKVRQALEQQYQAEGEVVVEEEEVMVAAIEPMPEVEPEPATTKDKLDALLALYMEDSISSREYHERRAEIMANR